MLGHRRFYGADTNASVYAYGFAGCGFPVSSAHDGSREAFSRLGRDRAPIEPLFAAISGFRLLCVTSSPPRAPAGCGPAGKKLWRDVLGAYLLTPGEREVLVALCHAVDQLAKLNAELVSAPLTVKGSRGQQVINPLMYESRQTAKTVETLQRALCLPAPGQRTGEWRNPNTKSAVDERWRRARTVKAREEGA
jgi:hypothetical protein